MTLPSEEFLKNFMTLPSEKYHACFAESRNHSTFECFHGVWTCPVGGGYGPFHRGGGYGETEPLEGIVEGGFPFEGTVDGLCLYTPP